MKLLGTPQPTGRGGCQRGGVCLGRTARPSVAPVLLLAIFLSLGRLAPLFAQAPGPIYEIRSPRERLELVVNESRIVTLSPELTKAGRIPQAQVGNRDLLEVTPLAPTQLQLFAKKAGVTQVNIWDELGQIYTLDVIILGDARELAMILESEFPGASLTVKPVGSSILISGYVDRPEDVSKIREIAEQFYPKVLTNINVSGVQQVLLHVKAMEVSRTKLRSLGLDWSSLSPNTLVQSMGAGLLTGVSAGAGGYNVSTTGTETFRLSIIDGNDAFFAVLDALRRDSLMQVLAEPTLVTVSGRPAFFQVGGEVPTLAPAGLGTVSVEYKRYGTQVDFVPIVLGNGRIRLEVRPRVSDVDLARSITVNGQTIYAFNTREVDTGVELQAGQTLAIAGLVQTRVEAERRGLPVLSELPLIGIPFRKVVERTNEVELLILVTPELVDALNPEEVPPGGPGLHSDRPSDWQLYVRGLLEVPRKTPAGSPGLTTRLTDALIVPPAEWTPSREELLLPEAVSSPRRAGSSPPPQQPPTPYVPERPAGAPSLSGTPSGLVPLPPTDGSSVPQLSPAAPFGTTVTTVPSEVRDPQALPGLIGPVGYEGSRP
ncbi:MAG: pilus assembly protein N-terminal domain-containing protein [Thermoguttaceae bacterium]|nr:pilus assembly protein N-terminal domain-containing protein [Thermoguttaceae bacterium]MDW8079588.1 pilus assembly protein N-terminal domain-containing protein [Thermoguttaceae bacterium]